MLDYVYGQDQIIAEFVVNLIPHCRQRGFGKCKAIGIIDESGKLIAGMVYNNWVPEAGVIEMSGAALPGKYWLTRETLRRIYRYPFEDCHCQMVVMQVAANDTVLLGVLAALGYNLIRVPRLHGRDKDAVLCLLTYEDWIANKITKRLADNLPPFLECMNVQPVEPSQSYTSAEEAA